MTRLIVATVVLLLAHILGDFSLTPVTVTRENRRAAMSPLARGGICAFITLILMLPFGILGVVIGLLYSAVSLAVDIFSLRLKHGFKGATFELFALAQVAHVAVILLSALLLMSVGKPPFYYDNYMALSFITAIVACALAYPVIGKVYISRYILKKPTELVLLERLLDFVAAGSVFCGIFVLLSFDGFWPVSVLLAALGLAACVFGLRSSRAYTTANGFQVLLAKAGLTLVFALALSWLWYLSIFLFAPAPVA